MPCDRHRKEGTRRPTRTTQRAPNGLLHATCGSPGVEIFCSTTAVLCSGLVFSRTTSCYVTHINTFGTLRPSKRKGVRNIQPHNIVKLYACLRESCLELLCFAVGRLPFQHARCPPACTQLRPKQVRFRAPHKQRRGQYKNNVRC